MKMLTRSRYRAALLALVMALLLIASACANEAQPVSNSAAPTTAAAEATAEVTAAPTPEAPAEDMEIDNTNTGIGVIMQEYFGMDDPVEILMITYDGQQEALAAYGGKNPEIEAINSQIMAGPMRLYEEFESDEYADSIQIRSYPTEDEDFIQIVTTCVVYPEVQPEEYTRMWSYNFSKTKNRQLTVGEMLAEYQLTEDDVLNRVTYLHEPENDEIIVGLEITGFLINRVPAKPVTHFLIEMMLETESDPFKSFYMYTTDLDNMDPTGEYDELTRLNPFLLFEQDIYELASLDPPLAYEWQSQTPGVVLSFDTTGMDDLGFGEYMYDGMLYVSLQDFPVVSYDMYNEDTLRERIMQLEGEDIKLITLTQNDGITEILTYPAWLVVYEKGGNEDTSLCMDIYFQTDTSEHRMHTSVSIDYDTEYHDETWNRLLSIMLVDE